MVMVPLVLTVLMGFQASFMLFTVAMVIVMVIIAMDSSVS
jgi:hypothetical protein